MKNTIKLILIDINVNVMTKMVAWRWHERNYH